MNASILWSRLDRPGHELCRLIQEQSAWHLSGTAIFVDDQQPCQLDYVIRCDLSWNTRSAGVHGWVGKKSIDIEMEVRDGQWVLNDQEQAELSGCVDVDLNFSPSTNLLPIRRLGLRVGEEAMVRAAWLRFPSFDLEPLDQRYRRIDLRKYHYESAGGRFQRDLIVNSAGFVTDYPEFWRAEAEL